jgi:putative transposase
MPRQPRQVVPGVPHHVTQRGSRRQPIFFSDNDRMYYLKTLSDYCAKRSVRCLAWCLMENHVHLVLVPPEADDLRAVIAPTHTRYSNHVNRANNWTGHLFEGRYWSYPMSEAHALVAARYVENNPVAAGLVRFAEDWRWSSAQAHITDRSDGLTDVNAFGSAITNWRAMLIKGLEASDEDLRIEKALRRGHLQEKK